MALGGKFENNAHILQVRIYYEDTDFSGIVYHASYLRFLERGRTELLRGARLDQSALHEDGLAFAVRRMNIDFLKPARMDDIISIITRPHEIRGASMVLAQEVRRADELLVSAHVTVAAIRKGRAVRIPDKLRLWLGRADPSLLQMQDMIG